MGRNITDYTNYNAPDSTYPYGDIKDNPGDGTGTRVSRTTNADMQQFFQRIAANAGVFLNGTPDNADNGFQYVEALNTLINQQTAGMAGAAGASGLVPVIMSGMVVHSGPTSTIDPGWFFYDGQYCFFEGGGYASIPGGDVRLITITYIDGFPNATLSLDTPVSDSTHFDFSDAISWAKSVGIITLQNEIALGSWIAVTPGTGWGAGSPAARFSKDGMGRVSTQSRLVVTNAITYGTPFTYPSTFRPAQNLLFICSTFDTIGGSYGNVTVLVNTSGVVTLISGGTGFTVGIEVDFSPLQFLTN